MPVYVKININPSINVNINNIYFVAQNCEKNIRACDKHLAEKTAVEFSMYDLKGSSVSSNIGDFYLTIPYPDNDDDCYIDGLAVPVN